MKVGRRKRAVGFSGTKTRPPIAQENRVSINSTPQEDKRRSASHFRKYGPYIKALEERGELMFPSQTALRLRYSYDDQVGLIYKYKVKRVAAFDIAGTHTPSGWRVGFMGALYYLVELIWIYHNGEIPDGYGVECVDGNKENFQISNLRLIPLKTAKFTRTDGSQENGADIIPMPKALAETHPIFADAFESVGVKTENGKYVASIVINGSIRKIGLFRTGDEANAALLGASSVLCNGIDPSRA